jgi:SAM-dependent methyltransferase
MSLIGGVRGLQVLDAGSGFGIGANLVAHWGASRVYAVELFRPMVESHKRLLTRDFPHLRNVFPIRADVAALPLADRSVDVVLSVEAISHYFDVERFIAECARVLRSGGKLVVSDGNNGLNARIRAVTQEIWQRWESGPHGTIGDHDIEKTFTERRAGIIRERFPDLLDDQVSAYAARTSGFDRAEIVAAISAHRAGGPAPASFYERNVVARDPELGSVVERLVDPVALGHDIEKRGFRVRVLPHFGGARNDFILAANLILRSLCSFRFARAFRIVATKQ